MVITLASLGKLLGQVVARQGPGLAIKQTGNKLWAVSAAREALGTVPPPHPTGRLAKWLKQPGTLNTSLDLSQRHLADIAQDVDEALGRSRRWRALDAGQRRERSTQVAAVLYEAVLSARRPQDAVRLGTRRVLSAMDDSTEELALQMSRHAADTSALFRSTSDAASWDRLERRLLLLPDTSHDDVRRAYEAHPGDTWLLVNSLTTTEANPRHVAAEWDGQLPEWLESPTHEVALAAAGLAVQ